MFAVGGEDEVPPGGGVSGAHLGGFLPEARGPQAELAVALQGRGLPIEPAHERHVPVEAFEAFPTRGGNPLREWSGGAPGAWCWGKWDGGGAMPPAAGGFPVGSGA